MNTIQSTLLQTNRLPALLTSRASGDTLGLHFRLTAWRRRRASSPTILTNTPEVDRHQQEEDHVSYVESYQCGLAYSGATDQNLIDGVAQNGGVGCQVGTYRDSPDSYLVPGQQVAGETQEKRAEEQPDADHPVKLSRWLIRAMI